MAEIRPLHGDADFPALPLAVRSSPSLARTSSSLALGAVRRGVLALARRDPAPLLALGFGVGLLARTAFSLAGRRRTHGKRETLAVETELLAIEAIVIRSTRLFRRR